MALEEEIKQVFPGCFKKPGMDEVSKTSSNSNQHSPDRKKRGARFVEYPKTSERIQSHNRLLDTRYIG